MQPAQGARRTAGASSAPVRIRKGRALAVFNNTSDAEDQQHRAEERVEDFHGRGGPFVAAVEATRMPMVVTYPIALYTATLVVFIIAAARGDPFWFWVAVVANIGGVIMAAVAALLGFVDWAVGIPNVSPAKGHGRIASAEK